MVRQTQTLWHVLKHSLPVCQRLAASTPSPIPACLSVPSSLAQFSPGFGMPFLEKTGSKQKSVVLLQPSICLSSVSVSAHLQGCRMQLVLEKGEGELFLERCYTGEVSRPHFTTVSPVSQFFLRFLCYLVTVPSQGWCLISPRLVQRKRREPMASQSGAQGQDGRFASV